MRNLHSKTQNQKAKGEETDNGYDFLHRVVFASLYRMSAKWNEVVHLQQQMKISIHIFCLLKPILQETIFDWLFFKCLGNRQTIYQR